MAGPSVTNDTAEVTAQHRVLVIDDDEDVRLITRVNLTFDGFSVDEAADGRTGLAQAREAPPDIVVLDVMMPGCDGLTVLREIRADPLLGAIPVALLTAAVSAAAETAGWAAGATAYLTKPFTAVALATTLRQLLAAKPADREQRHDTAVARLDLAHRLSRERNPSDW